MSTSTIFRCSFTEGNFYRKFISGPHIYVLAIIYSFSKYYIQYIIFGILLKSSYKEFVLIKSVLIVMGEERRYLRARRIDSNQLLPRVSLSDIGEC